MSVEQWGALEQAVRVKLESIVPGVRLVGVAGTTAVTVLSSKWFGSSIIQVAYSDVNGATGQTLLRRDVNRPGFVGGC